MDEHAAAAAATNDADQPPGGVTRYALSEADSTRYVLSEAAPTSRLKALAALAPTLKPGALRVLLYLESITENSNPHATRLALRDLVDGTKLALSAVQVAIDHLAKRKLISYAPGTATKKSFFLVNSLATTKISVPFSGTPPAAKGCDSNRHTSYLFQAQGAPLAGTPTTENEALAADAPRVDIEGFSFTPESVIDRLLAARPKRETPDRLALARSWMHGYASKFPPTLGPNPHPPDDTICAQLLAVAEWPRLERVFQDLMIERKQAGDSYGWFVTVALQRIHGIQPGVLKQRRAELKLVRRAGQLAGEVADPQAAADLLDQVSRATSRLK